jgi:dimethylhistidine N-methyltransferase
MTAPLGSEANTAHATRKVRDAAREEFLADVLAGLSRPQKRLPCKYFYDAHGSRLFDAICELDEYYLTRAELEILQAHADAMAAVIGPRALLVEYGSGSSVKTRLLLDRLAEPAGYAPVDVSREHLLAASRAIAADYPELRVLPICADFTRPFAIPVSAPGRRFVYFPGSTIGNFERRDACDLLRRIAATPGCDGAIVGFDLQKPRELLEAAYNDRRGVTAAFNMNLLARINAELGGDFDLDRFFHRARYDAAAHRIEMLLVSAARQRVTVAGETFAFAAGETILTELSHKYTFQGFSDMAEEAGMTLRRAWTDAGRRFAVAHLACA